MTKEYTKLIHEGTLENSHWGRQTKRKGQRLNTEKEGKNN